MFMNGILVSVLDILILVNKIKLFPRFSTYFFHQGFFDISSQHIEFNSILYIIWVETNPHAFILKIDRVVRCVTEILLSLPGPYSWNLMSIVKIQVAHQNIFKTESFDIFGGLHDAYNNSNYELKMSKKINNKNIPLGNFLEKLIKWLRTVKSGIRGIRKVQGVRMESFGNKISTHWPLIGPKGQK